MNKLVAIVGMSGSGKSVATEYLEQEGWCKLYFGGITYKLMEQQGIERTPDGKSEKEFREQLRKTYGPECYAKLIEEDIKKNIDRDIVLDGMYSWYEYKYLIERHPNLIVICIVIDKDIRYDRLSKRIDRPFKREDSIYRDINEIENLYKGGPIAYADYYILNNGSKEEYLARLKEILEVVK